MGQQEPVMDTSGPAEADWEGELRRRLTPPSTAPYCLDAPERKTWSQNGEDLWADALLQGLTGGFFVEAGAYNGEDLSTTLFLERARQWTGLLVEPSPALASMLRAKQRRAHCLEAGLSPTGVPCKEQLKLVGYLSALERFQTPTHVQANAEWVRTVQNLDAADGPQAEFAQRNYMYDLEAPARQADVARIKQAFTGDTVEVPCFPLGDVLQHLQVPVVDFFTLDVEGCEDGILASIPFDTVEFGLIVVEVNDRAQPSAIAIDARMRQQGFVRLKDNGQDWFFANPSYLAKRGLLELSLTRTLQPEWSTLDGARLALKTCREKCTALHEKVAGGSNEDIPALRAKLTEYIELCVRAQERPVPTPAWIGHAGFFATGIEGLRRLAIFAKPNGGATVPIEWPAHEVEEHLSLGAEAQRVLQSL